MAAERFYEALGDIARYVHASDDEIHRTLTFPSREGTRRGYRIRHRGTSLAVHAAPTDRFFAVAYHYELSTQFQGRLTEDELRSYAGELDLPVGHEDLPEAAGNARVRELDPDIRESAFENARRESRERGTRLTVFSLDGDDDIQDGIAVSDRLYAYADDFDLQAYDEVLDRIARDGEAVASVLHGAVPALQDDGPDGVADADEESLNRGWH